MDWDKILVRIDHLNEHGNVIKTAEVFIMRFWTVWTLKKTTVEPIFGLAPSEQLLYILQNGLQKFLRNDAYISDYNISNRSIIYLISKKSEELRLRELEKPNEANEWLENVAETFDDEYINLFYERHPQEIEVDQQEGSESRASFERLRKALTRSMQLIALDAVKFVLRQITGIEYFTLLAFELTLRTKTNEKGKQTPTSMRERNETEHDTRNGIIVATDHIFKGYDKAVDQASQCLLRAGLPVGVDKTSVTSTPSIDRNQIDNAIEDMLSQVTTTITEGLQQIESNSVIGNCRQSAAVRPVTDASQRNFKDVLREVVKVHLETATRSKQNESSVHAHSFDAADRAATAPSRETVNFDSKQNQHSVRKLNNQQYNSAMFASSSSDCLRQITSASSFVTPTAATSAQLQQAISAIGNNFCSRTDITLQQQFINANWPGGIELTRAIPFRIECRRQRGLMSPTSTESSQCFEEIVAVEMVDCENMHITALDGCLYKCKLHVPEPLNQNELACLSAACTQTTNNGLLLSMRFREGKTYATTDGLDYTLPGSGLLQEDLRKADTTLSNLIFGYDMQTKKLTRCTVDSYENPLLMQLRFLREQNPTAATVAFQLQSDLQRFAQINAYPKFITNVSAYFTICDGFLKCHGCPVQLAVRGYYTDPYGTTYSDDCGIRCHANKSFINDFSQNYSAYEKSYHEFRKVFSFAIVNGALLHNKRGSSLKETHANFVHECPITPWSTELLQIFVMLSHYTEVVRQKSTDGLTRPFLLLKSAAETGDAEKIQSVVKEILSKGECQLTGATSPIMWKLLMRDSLQLLLNSWIWRSGQKMPLESFDSFREFLEIRICPTKLHCGAEHALQIRAIELVFQISWDLQTWELFDEMLDYLQASLKALLKARLQEIVQESKSTRSGLKFGFAKVLEAYMVDATRIGQVDWPHSLKRLVDRVLHDPSAATNDNSLNLMSDYTELDTFYRNLYEAKTNEQLQSNNGLRLAALSCLILHITWRKTAGEMFESSIETLCKQLSRLFASLFAAFYLANGTTENHRFSRRLWLEVCLQATGFIRKVANVLIRKRNIERLHEIESDIFADLRQFKRKMMTPKCENTDLHDDAYSIMKKISEHRNLVACYDGTEMVRPLFANLMSTFWEHIFADEYNANVWKRTAKIEELMHR